ncbi:MAG: hypothetical protein ACXAC7_16545 [Candidatus Hodarchaeales archaeon]|jgi:Mg/Co/Ni transporter MgtE
MDKDLNDEFKEEWFNKIEKFYEILKKKDGSNNAFSLFENFHSGIQAAILLDLPDNVFWNYLQDLESEQVLSILKTPSIEFRDRFLKILEPQVKKAVELELKSYSEKSNERTGIIEKNLLIIISNILALIGKYNS